jgi:XTP/dITP diphosphohydrolase
VNPLGPSGPSGGRSERGVWPAAGHAVPRRLLVATRSTGKLRELIPMCAARGIDAIDLAAAGIEESPAEDALEIHTTFEENAVAKARYFHGRSGLPTLADDSGLVVAALGGRPGVLSKRWSGRTDLRGQALDDANNRLLLQLMRGSADRRAAYVCAAAFVASDRPGDQERDDALVRRGEVRGRITEAPRGTGGFGYDPYFLSDELGCTFGEATPEEKARVSHRARAVAALLDALSASS